MADISGFGTVANLVASNTFPNGFDLTQFADDADSIDIPGLEIAQTAMGLNGDLITWSAANPVVVTINLIPNQEDDNNFEAVGEANRVARGKSSARDELSLTYTLPDGKVATFTVGKLVNYMPFQSVASSSRLKTKAYTIHFESFTLTRA